MSSQHASQFAVQLSRLTSRFHEEHDLVVKAFDSQVAALSGEVEHLTARLLKTQEGNGFDCRENNQLFQHGMAFEKTMIGGQMAPRSLIPHAASKNRTFNPVLLKGLSPLRESRENNSDMQTRDARDSEVDVLASRSSSFRVRITESASDEGDVALDGEEHHLSYLPIRDTAFSRLHGVSEKSWTVMGSEPSMSMAQSPSNSPGGVAHGILSMSNASSEGSRNSIIKCTNFVGVTEERRFPSNSDQAGGLGSRRVGNKFSIDEVFPPWFNPFVQETYVGKREGATMGSQIIQAIRLRSDYNLDELEHPKCILRPMGQPVMVWTMVWVMALTYDIWVTPLESAFIDEEYMPTVYQHLNYAILAFFCLDIVLNFFMGYLDGEIEVLDRRKIAMVYLKGWFIIDVLATMPWYMIIDVGREVSTTRAAKAFKAMKVVKTLRILKIYKYNLIIRQAKLTKYQREVSKSFSKKDHTLSNSRFEPLFEQLQGLEMYFRPMFLPFKATLVAVILGHAHTAFYALSNGWTPSSDIGLGFDRYYESLRWYFCLLTFGSITTTEHRASDNGILELVVLVERLILVTLFLSRITFGTLVLQQEEAKIQMKYADTMDYLRQHDVSARTRAQVRFNVKETSKHRAVHAHFLDLCRDNLPEHLQSQICKELWAKHLVTFGLFNEISKWNEEFIAELCTIVTEKTYASKVVVFQENDAVHEALMVLKGRLTVKSSFQKDPIPGFTDGMWIGEKGLINIGLRRSGTCVTEVMSNVMAVPVYGFQLLLDRLGVLNRFQEFCCNELWRGVCGRCGKMSDHFSNTCPLVTHHIPKIKLRQYLSPSATTRFGSLTHGIMQRCASMGFGGKEGNRLSDHTAGSIESGSNNLDTARLAHDTKLFLMYHNLQMIAPDLERNGVVTLDDLSTFLATRKHDYDSSVAGPEVIRAFREEMANETKRMLSLRMSQHDYFVFVSHFKVEAGTEAALIRAELQQLIDEDEGHPAKDLHTAIFLDAEDLKDLGILLKAVSKSHNMMLLLTPGVLTRPWCLMEIAAAVRANVNLLPVLITKPGCEFIFPDEKFYSEFLAGKTVGQGGVSEVQKQGFEMTEICKALRKLFETIAMPYSPHRTASIRSAECKSILSRCTCRAINKDNQGRRPTLVQSMIGPSMPTHPMQDSRMLRDARHVSQMGMSRRGSTESFIWEIKPSEAHSSSHPVTGAQAEAANNAWFSPRSRPPQM